MLDTAHRPTLVVSAISFSIFNQKPKNLRLINFSQVHWRTVFDLILNLRYFSQ